MRADWRAILRHLRAWWLPALFIWAFLAAGLGVLGWGLWQTALALSSAGWPIAAGTITASSIGVSQDADGTMYSPDVRYDYSVDGAALRGFRVDLGEYSSSDPASAEKLIARYPVGQQVQVYYDPHAPSESLLEPGFTAGLWIPLGLGVVFTILGGLMTRWLFGVLRRSGLPDDE